MERQGARGLRKWLARALIVSVLPVVLAAGGAATAQADTWNGYGYQYAYRMKGDNVVRYWFDANLGAGSYDEAMSSAIIAWRMPRAFGGYEADGFSACLPYNGVSALDSSYASSELVVTAIPLTGSLAYVNAMTQFYTMPGSLPADPNATAYDWAKVTFNTTVMNSRSLWYGVGSKRAVAAHEFGHVLGLGHYQAAGTVLAQQDYRTAIGPTCEDNLSVRVRW